MGYTTDQTEVATESATSVRRRRFNTEVAPAIARELKLPPLRLTGRGYSQRFAVFADDERFAVVAGSQEGDHVELALAHGVRHAKGRALTLVLPDGHTNATMQRVAWLREPTRPVIYTHRDGRRVKLLTPLTQQRTLDALAQTRKGLSPAEELAKATAPVHLGKATDVVWPLVEWATTCPLLDPGHRSGERSWHYAGQRVLTISRATGGVSIVAGIHYGGAKKPQAVPLEDGKLPDESLTAIKQAVNEAINKRKKPGTKAIHRPDEHWLQAILRRVPYVLGIEQPALRELPAWRPHDSNRKWGRGYVDLLGLDGHGAIRIVETKLATNRDDLLVLQGLDYFVWATAYIDVLRARLGVGKRAELEVHYVVGTDGNDNSFELSPCTRPLAAALDDRVRWRFQVVRNWFHPPDDTRAVVASIFGPSTVPTP